MKKKQLFYVLSGIFAVIVCMILVLGLRSCGDSANKQPNQTGTSVSRPSDTWPTAPVNTRPVPSDPGQTAPQGPEDPAGDSNQTEPQDEYNQGGEVTTEPDSADPEVTGPVQTTPGSSEPKPTEPKPTEPKPTQITQPETTEPYDPTVKLPYAVPNTGIVILSVNSYDGVFLEDGFSTPATGICALLILNRGESDAELIAVSMNCDGEPLTFIASDVPAGAYVFVQERSGAKYVKGEYTDCEVEVADDVTLGLAADEIRFEENEDGSLTVTNLTDKSYSEVRLFYKFYMPDEDVYVGGITYTVRIQSLAAHDSINVKPSHYFPGSSKVVMVRTYD